MWIYGGKVLLGKHFEACDIRIEDGRIAALLPRKTHVRAQDTSERVSRGNGAEEEAVLAETCYVIPGLVEVHMHGAMGDDVSDGTEAALHSIAAYALSQGVTTLVPATMTLPVEKLCRVLDAVRSFREHAVTTNLQGIHLEGPFINPLRAGAQKKEHVILPDADVMERLCAAGDDVIRLMTLAPEMEGALELIQSYATKFPISIGHTNCSYEIAQSAFLKGADHVTHVFNAMDGLQHRQPGPIAAAYEQGAYAELICDGYHVAPAMVRLAFSMFGERLVLISDSMRGAGMPDGMYTLGGNEVYKTGNKATLADGTLAGSVCSLLDCMRTAVSFGIPLEQAVYAATYAAAKSIRMEDVCGIIAVGRNADLVILGEDLSLRGVIFRGKAVAPPRSGTRCDSEA